MSNVLVRVLLGKIKISTASIQKKVKIGTEN